MFFCLLKHRVDGDVRPLPEVSNFALEACPRKPCRKVFQCRELYEVSSRNCDASSNIQNGLHDVYIALLFGRLDIDAVSNSHGSCRE